MQRNYLVNKKPNSIYQDIWQLHMLMLNFVHGQITGSGLFSKQAQGHEFEGPHKKQGQSKIFATVTQNQKSFNM